MLDEITYKNNGMIRLKCKFRNEIRTGPSRKGCSITHLNCPYDMIYPSICDGKIEFTFTKYLSYSNRTKLK